MTIGAATHFATILSQRGETVTWYANTEVTDMQSGDPIEGFDAGTSISVIIVNIPKRDVHDSAGELTNQHAYMYVGASNNVAIKDKILRDSVNYDVDNILKQIYDAGTLVMRKYLIRKLVTDA